jgi:hypothetical protein
LPDATSEGICYRACSRTDPARLKGLAMINLDDIEDRIRELERAACPGLAAR